MRQRGVVCIEEVTFTNRRRLIVIHNRDIIVGAHAVWLDDASLSFEYDMKVGAMQWRKDEKKKSN